MKLSRRIDQFLLITGSALLLVYACAQIRSLVLSRAAVWSFGAHQSRPTSSQPVSQPAVPSRADFTLWSKARIKQYQAALGMKLEAPLAVLSIPKLGLEVPVFDGTDELTLNRGAGRIAGTARPGEPGNIGIAAHRDGFFRGLKDICVGDRIELDAQDGAFAYVVDNIEIVKPTEVGVLRAWPQPSLTLVTCYPFYFIGDAPERYIVHASLVAPQRVIAPGWYSAAQRNVPRH